MRTTIRCRLICLAGLTMSLANVSVSAQDARGRLEHARAQIAYRAVGAGSPLLLVHGFFATGQAWDPFVEELSTSYRLIVPDMRGHGHSTNPAGVFLHRDSAGDLLALLDHLGVTEVQAVGHSSGAMTLLHAATLQPERFRSLVLLGGTPYSPETNRSLQRALTFDSFSPETLITLRRWHPGGDEQIRRLVSHFNGMSENYDDMNFTPPFLGTISAETLIVHGDRDEYFPVEITLEMFRAIPNSYLWVPPNANHALVFWGSSFPGADSLLSILQEFLAGEWSSPK